MHTFTFDKLKRNNVAISYLDTLVSNGTLAFEDNCLGG